MNKIDSVPVLSEGPRGCGHRRAGGLYLVADGVGAPCGRLPLPLHKCPTCSGGIKPSRGWTWIDPAALFAGQPCAMSNDKAFTCVGCSLGDQSRPPMDGSLHGLIWIGEQFYPTPADWLREVKTMGVSRRLPALPKGLELGKTFVFVAHRLACDAPCECIDDDGHAEALCEACGGSGSTKGPGIFHVFKAQQVQYVCHGDETDRELEAFEERGIVPVRIDAVQYSTEGSPVIQGVTP